jgi:hypothetical protein
MCVSMPSNNRAFSAALLFGLLLLPCAGRAQVTPPDPKLAAEFAADSEAGLKALQTWYVSETGLWKTTNWWNAANAVTVMGNYSKLSNSPDFLPILANTFDLNSKKNFLNEYYDDEGWWALGWAGAYELTHEARYLEMAELIFADMAGAGMTLPAAAASGGRSPGSTRTPLPTSCSSPWPQGWRVSHKTRRNGPPTWTGRSGNGSGLRHPA